MADSAQFLRVEICYAKNSLQIMHDLTVPEGTTVHQAIHQSGILASAPEIDLTVCRVGIYGKLKSLDTIVRDHDRIEVYRALQADPKDSRRRRATHKLGKNPAS